LTTADLLFKREDAEGVWPLLVLFSGYSAMQRNSELIEPCDLIKAIYIVDLEHVVSFWDNWENFERLVSAKEFGADSPVVYFNRFIYLLTVQLMLRDISGGITFGRLSPAVQEILAAAKDLPRKQARPSSFISSRDLLFCTVNQSEELSSILIKSGLLIDKLSAAVLG
jgi:hypothetical protein